MTWRVAKALETLRAQIDAAHPSRRKDSDGTIGDAAHASRTSDHNPWVQDAGVGVVTAMDITHDPAGGVDSYALADLLRQRRDPRIKYVISNRRIFSSQVNAWEWRPYTGINPHDHHVHVSVLSDKAHYDDTTAWSIAGTAAPAAPAQSTLQKGSTGPDVQLLQHLLQIPADGVFGDATEAAVRAFQGVHALVADGVVGTYTWRALSSTPTGIVATIFGGAGDHNKSAYDGHVISDNELGVALPYRFPGARPQVVVTNQANGKSVVCAIVDVGPWNINDPYWSRAVRPEAESGIDATGRHTNGAGIDLTPAAARAIGLAGKGLVDWKFVNTTSPQEKKPVTTATTTTPAATPSVPATVSLDLGSLITALGPSVAKLLPGLLPIATAAAKQAVPGAAPFIEVGESLYNTYVAYEASDKSLATVEKLIAAELRQIADALDPPTVVTAAATPTPAVATPAPAAAAAANPT